MPPLLSAPELSLKYRCGNFGQLGVAVRVTEASASVLVGLALTPVLQKQGRFSNGPGILGEAQRGA